MFCSGIPVPGSEHLSELQRGTCSKNPTIPNSLIKDALSYSSIHVFIFQTHQFRRPCSGIHIPCSRNVFCVPSPGTMFPCPRIFICLSSRIPVPASIMSYMHSRRSPHVLGTLFPCPGFSVPCADFSVPCSCFPYYQNSCSPVPGSPFRVPISSAILQLQEAGRLHILKNRWWKQRRGGGKCDVRLLWEEGL